MRISLIVLTAFVVVVPTVAQTPQPAWKGENLQFFPKDIARALTFAAFSSEAKLTPSNDTPLPPA